MLVLLTSSCLSVLAIRIYLSPRGQATNSNWHYIDVSTAASLVPFAIGISPLASNAAYESAGIYSPVEERIYMGPANAGTYTQWHYINTADGSVVPYTHGLTVTLTAHMYYGGVYSPATNRVYFSRFSGSSTVWHYHDGNSGSDSMVEFSVGATALGGYMSGVLNPNGTNAPQS